MSCQWCFEAALNRTGRYPRYRVTLPGVPLERPGVHTFHLSGLPPVPLTLQLRVDANHPYNKYNQLKVLRTHVAITLADEKGRILGRASGPLDQWALSWGAGIAGFYQAGCVRLDISQYEDYTLKVVVNRVDPSFPPLTAHPTLQGGGREMF